MMAQVIARGLFEGRGCWRTRGTGRNRRPSRIAEPQSHPPCCRALLERKVPNSGGYSKPGALPPIGPPCYYDMPRRPISHSAPVRAGGVFAVFLRGRGTLSARRIRVFSARDGSAIFHGRCRPGCFWEQGIPGKLTVNAFMAVFLAEKTRPNYLQIETNVL